jgi:hypothetical protein
MKFYEGPREDDPGPIGGGAFNDGNQGGETHNFLVRETGRVLGFVHSGRKLDNLNLRRIDPACDPNAALLQGVRVILLAAYPKNIEKPWATARASLGGMRMQLCTIPPNILAQTHKPGTTIWRRAKKIAGG